MADEPNDAGEIDTRVAATDDIVVESYDVDPFADSGGIPAPPGDIRGASQLPPASVETLESIAAAVGRIRDEIDASSDPSRKARLLHEVGEIEELGGDEAGAARDYLAAYNSDTTFREPLEGLVRLLERRRSLANLGKLVEALVAAASSPEERARALTERAAFLEDVQTDLEGARGAAREATETGAAAADLGPAWLTLELVSAKLADSAQREEALAGRADLTSDPTWRGLLLHDVAMLCIGAGDVDRAIEFATMAREAGHAATWRATCALERITREERGLPGSETARKRARLNAEALEAHAKLVRAALVDPNEADTLGVPGRVRTLEHATELLLRAAEARRGSGELTRAAENLDAALSILDDRPNADDEPTVGGAQVGPEFVIERLVLNARLRVAEIMGDTTRAADLAKRRMVGELDGGVVASLAMRVAEHAASEGDLTQAFAALSLATERDPASAPARALKLDILDASPDPARFAEELEDLAQRFSLNEARARALILAAFVWTTRAHLPNRARAALDGAAACGVSADRIARIGRCFASLERDDAWYEAATENLLASAAPSEAISLWVELARFRLLRGDIAQAGAAFAALRQNPEGNRLGRLLEAFAGASTSAEADVETSRAALLALTAASSGTEQRTFAMVAALRAHAAGDAAASIQQLRFLANEDPSDPLVAAYLGDLLRAGGSHTEAAEAANAVAEAHSSEPYRAARLLEAGFEFWRAGDRVSASKAFDTATTIVDAASTALAWSARGVEIDALEGRRRALELAGTGDGINLERFALEALLGDPDDAATALSQVESAPHEAVRLAGALARLAWPRGGLDPAAFHQALTTLSEVSPDIRRATAAEKVRFLREESEGASATELTDAAREWLDAGGGAVAAVEWLSTSLAGAEPAQEIAARRALAEHLEDEPREAMFASAALLEMVALPGARQQPLSGVSQATRLANLELAPPGCDPRRRADALRELGAALGDEAELDAMALAAWSLLATGDAQQAMTAFRTVTVARPSDLQAWEGMRAAAEVLSDREIYAVACEQLGAKSAHPTRGAAFWEQAALAWASLGAALDPRVDAALDASFTRDPARITAFDRLFRRVRERKDGAKLLDLIGRRLEVTDDPQEIAKLYWETARVLREQGDPDGALEALEHVTMFDENHVGALALTGEIFIRRGMFTEAAEKLARLATVEAAPPKNRITAGVAAVDLYENKLGRHDLALGVLLALHTAQLTTLPVRERLARAAARNGAWGDATGILEVLMHERPEREGRIEAARLAMAIHRDRRFEPSDGLPAATKIIEESPSDSEAIELLVSLPSSPQLRGLLERARDALLMTLHESPSRVEEQRRLAVVARALGDTGLEQSALSCAVALGGPDGSSERALSALMGARPRAPQMAINETMLRQVMAPGDDGPVAELFAALGPTLAEALGPQLSAVGVSKKDRVDPRAGLALRNEIATWAGAFGITSFELYVGGQDPHGVQGIPGESPALVVGAAINTPLSPGARARIARELLAMVRGTTILRWRDETTLAAIVAAACNIAKVPISHPPFAMLAEVERLIGKAISRKTKAAIVPLCKAIVAQGQDPKAWVARARASHARIGALASGDAGVVLAELFAEREGMIVKDDPRTQEVLRFVLSRPFFELRRAIGLEG